MAQQPGYIWGGSTGISSPQELSRRRQLVEAIQARNGQKLPRNLPEGLVALADAIGSRVQMNRLDKEEKSSREASGAKFNSYFDGLSNGGAETADAKPAPHIGMVRDALLGAIAKPESGGAYDTIYGGGKMAGFGDHPRQAVPITTGPNAGRTSSAAGKYQMLGSTWDEQKAKLKLPDFGPESQDAAAWDLATTTYNKKTGGNLANDLSSGNPENLKQVADALNGVWTSMPGGIEQGIDANSFASTFQKNLGMQPQPASFPGPGPIGLTSEAQTPEQRAKNPNMPQANGLSFDPKLMEFASDPWLSDGQRLVVQALLKQQMEKADPRNALELRKLQAETSALENPKADPFTLTPGQQRFGPDGKLIAGLPPEAKPPDPFTLSEGQQRFGPDGRLLASIPAKPDKPTDDISEYNFYSQQARAAGQQPMPFDQWQITNKKAGASTFNMGGGSDKQIFDAMNESATSARSAFTGLKSLREAKKAVSGGVITGAWANERLALRKIGALLGGDPQKIENTETFRSAIAPQVAALMKATVGSTQISNADREFAEKAAGGSINLDERTIVRLIDIMERAGTVAIQAHGDRLNKVYPDQKGFDRERALLGVDMLPPLPAEERTGPPTLDDLEAEMKRRGLR